MAEEKVFLFAEDEPVSFAEEQTELMYTVYQWFEANKGNFGLEITLFVEGSFAVIDDILYDYNCDVDGATFQQEDILKRWNLNRHYPLLQPDERRDHVPSTYLEFVDYLKALQYHIKFPCDYYENDASRSAIIEYDLTFMLMREGVYEFIRAYKTPRKIPDSEAELLKMYSVRPTNDRTKKVGIESAGKRELPRAWNKTGGQCRSSNSYGQTYTEYDKLAYATYSWQTRENTYLPQCSISGSTHAVLSTFLWCSSNMALSRGEMARVLLAIITVLVLDGGHAIQECVSAMGIVACAYPMYGKLLTEMGLGDPMLFKNVRVLYSLISPIQFFPLERRMDVDMDKIAALFNEACVDDLKLEKKDRMKLEKKLEIFSTILGSAVGNKIAFYESKRIIDHLLAEAMQS
jgi:hypothetical protein